MDRVKSPRLVITFPTTTTAMLMDSVCGEELGRLIPIPREISAGCGLAWCASPKQKEILQQIMKDNKIACEEIHMIEMF